jgi:hypothetical protein
VLADLQSYVDLATRLGVLASQLVDPWAAVALAMVAPAQKNSLLSSVLETLVAAAFAVEQLAQSILLPHVLPRLSLN